jgi:hypothetical protein
MHENYWVCLVMVWVSIHAYGYSMFAPNDGGVVSVVRWILAVNMLGIALAFYRRASGP